MQARDVSTANLKPAENQKYLKGNWGAWDGMKC